MKGKLCLVMVAILAILFLGLAGCIKTNTPSSSSNPPDVTKSDVTKSLSATTSTTSPNPSTTSNAAPDTSTQLRTSPLIKNFHLPTGVPQQPPNGVTGITMPMPTINEFNANPESIKAGESSTLSWYVSNAKDAYLYSNQGSNGVGLKGSISVTPGTTTNYILVAENNDGVGVGKLVTVFVNTPGTNQPGGPNSPVINYFTATPLTIINGSKSTLSWDISNATSAQIEPGVNGHLPGQQVELKGSMSVTPPPGPTTYILTALNPPYAQTQAVVVVIGSIIH